MIYSKRRDTGDDRSQKHEGQSHIFMGQSMLSKRYIIETINDPLKNISYIEHSKHRSMNGFMLNLLAGLVTYCLKENKPSLDLTDVERNSMVIA